MSEYVDGGRLAARQLAAALGPDGIAGRATVLDFGCGPGRVLSAIAAVGPDARLVGVDVDADAVRWGTEHLSAVDLRVCAASPPLAVRPGEFDLVYSVSVFSHLDAGDQDAWLAEVARVLAPDGVALLSTHGASAFEAFRSGRVRTAWCAPGAFERGPLAGDEMVSVPYRASRWSRGDLPGVGEGYGLTFHGEDYIREHWGAFLAIDRVERQAVSGWQDLVVARRRVESGSV